MSVTVNVFGMFHPQGSPLKETLIEDKQMSRWGGGALDK